jgi:hypothetical protein
MARKKNPPQGGEKYLCLTLFCTMMLSVMSSVAIIYAIVIIYVPAKKVLESNLTGPKMCTTLALEENLVGVEVCDGWTACVEWCLSKVSPAEFKKIVPLYVEMRKLNFFKRG